MVAASFISLTTVNHAREDAHVLILRPRATNAANLYKAALSLDLSESSQPVERTLAHRAQLWG